MLKSHVGDETWLIQQPAHAQASGFLAAHFGGVNGSLGRAITRGPHTRSFGATRSCLGSLSTTTAGGKPRRCHVLASAMGCPWA